MGKSREAQRRSNQKVVDKKREYIRRHRESNPCCDCGGWFPWYVMELDHPPGVEVRRLRSGERVPLFQYGWDDLKKALKEQLHLVCANCHKRRTYLRKQQMKSPGRPRLYD